jgi:hypothetical protein
MEDKFVQFWKAKFPIDMTLFGIVTEVILVQLSNAWSPMVCVANPPNVDGIVIAPPAPVYPVTVALPLLTVYV